MVVPIEFSFCLTKALRPEKLDLRAGVKQRTPPSRTSTTSVDPNNQGPKYAELSKAHFYQQLLAWMLPQKLAQSRQVPKVQLLEGHVAGELNPAYWDWETWGVNCSSSRLASP